MDTLNTSRHRTNTDPDLVRAYLDEIGTVPLLTAEQEVDLAKRIEAGVYAAELLRRGSRKETWACRAVEKFDYTKGYKFSTYAMVLQPALAAVEMRSSLPMSP